MEKEVFSGHANAERVFIRDVTPQREAIFFRARSSGGGSGWGLLLTLLVPDQRTKSLRNLLPPIVVSNQGEYRFWSEPRFSGYQLLIVADVHANGHETHFAAHRYSIRTYVYCRSRDSYVLADEYITATKYPSLDEVDQVRVIAPEQAAIARRLLSSTRNLTNCS